MKENRKMRHWTLKELNFTNPTYLLLFIDRHIDVLGRRNLSFESIYSGIDHEYDIILNSILNDDKFCIAPEYIKYNKAVRIKRLIIKEPGWSKPKYIYNIFGTKINDDYKGGVKIVYTMNINGNECLIIHNRILETILTQFSFKFKNCHIPLMDRIHDGYFGWIKEINNYIFEKEFMEEFKDDCHINNFSVIKMLILTSPYTIYNDFFTNCQSIDVIINEYKKHIDSDDFETKYEQDLDGLIKLKRWIFNNDVCRNNFIRLSVLLLYSRDPKIKTYRDDIIGLDKLLSKIFDNE